jgi:hypothetical protein
MAGNSGAVMAKFLWLLAIATGTWMFMHGIVIAQPKVPIESYLN